jgi:hypothetical protein
MNWNSELKNIQKLEVTKDAESQANFIMNKMIKAVLDGYQGKTFGFHITPECGKILTEQGLGWKSYKEEEPDIYSLPFEESSVWIKH